MPDAATVARRLSTAYFTYYATIGLEYVYLPFFFTNVGLSPGDLGVLYAGRVATSIVFQPLTTRLADRTGKPYLTLKLAMVLGLVSASGLYFAQGLASAAVFMWTQAAFRSVAIPILDATTLHEHGAERYGRIRLWGSIGYGVAALGLASVVGAMAYDQAGATALPAYLAANAIMVLAMFWLPRGMSMEHPPAAGTVATSRLPAGVIALMVIGAIHWASVEAYNVFFSSHVRWRGFAPNVPGLGVAAAIAGETITLYFFGAFLKRAPAATWIIVSLSLSVFRWLGTAYATTPALLIAVQAGHAFSFALWWVAQLAVFRLNAPPGRRAAMQGLYTAATLGIGGALGTSLSGRVFDSHGGQWMFTVAAVLEVVAVLIAVATRRWWWKVPERA
ncbi:MAG: MFS transporter [Myxococcota bacterium]|nr:MFS transporter [Myxococcota bacterium]